MIPEVKDYLEQENCLTSPPAPLLQGEGGRIPNIILLPLPS